MSRLYNNHLLGESCIIAKNREKRPIITNDNKKSCPFCKINEKLLDQIWLRKLTLDQDEVRIVNNKYPITSEGLEGIHDVVIDTCYHNKALVDFSLEHLTTLFKMMQERYLFLILDHQLQCIQIFKNSGKQAGASIAHSHWQIIGLKETPLTVKASYIRIYKHYEEEGCSFCSKKQGILICENRLWEAIAPFTTAFQHETWLILKKHKASFGDLELEELKELAHLIKQVFIAYKSILPDMDYNICMMSDRPNKDRGYHFYIKILPRIGYLAGFELATKCHIHTVEPIEHTAQMRRYLGKEEK